MTRVGPFWRYYGGKWRAAPRYPAPHYDTIVEPFAGAAGYSCRWWHGKRRVMLYDVDEHVAATWRYLLTADPREIAALPDVPDGGDVRDLPIPPEAQTLVGWWLNQGTTNPCRTPSKWARESSGFVRWADARERVARDAAAIRGAWTITEAPWWDAVDVEATWFVDPPYSTPAGRHYRHDAVDFDALAEWCRARQGQVVVCEQYGADWLPFRPFGEVKPTAGKHRTGRNREVIWTKGPGTQVPMFDEAAR